MLHIAGGELTWIRERSRLPSGYQPIESTPGGLPAVFLTVDSDGIYDAALLCVRREVGVPLVDIQVD